MTNIHGTPEPEPTCPGCEEDEGIINDLEQQLKDCQEWMTKIVASGDLLDWGWTLEFQERGEQLVIKGDKE